ncbi:MAG: HEPN domain-containing protein [Odoribacter splanchnicus]
MKQQLDENSIQALVGYRLQRAKETLREADILSGQECFNAAINRLYYACFYAISALLVKNKITAHTHQGVKQMFRLHFVATGKVSNEYVRFYSQLFNDRVSGDYDDFLFLYEKMLQAIRP